MLILIIILIVAGVMFIYDSKLLLDVYIQKYYIENEMHKFFYILFVFVTELLGAYYYVAFIIVVAYQLKNITFILWALENHIDQLDEKCRSHSNMDTTGYKSYQAIIANDLGSLIEMHVRVKE